MLKLLLLLPFTAFALTVTDSQGNTYVADSIEDGTAALSNEDTFEVKEVGFVSLDGMYFIVKDRKKAEFLKVEN